jgi:hypothetical protein
VSRRRLRDSRFHERLPAVRPGIVFVAYTVEAATRVSDELPDPPDERDQFVIRLV